MTADDDSVSRPPEGQRKGVLADVIPRDWFTDPKTSKAWVLIGTFLEVDRETLARALREANWKRGLPVPVVTTLGELHGLQIPVQRGYWARGAEGQSTWYVNIDQMKVGQVECWIILTPYVTDGGEPDSTARLRVDRHVALLRAACGRNMLRDILFEGPLGATGDFSVIGEMIRVPQAIDGPVIHVDFLQDVGDALLLLANEPDDRRRRIELAIEFLSEAIRKNDDFLSYWSALELVADGKAGKIRGRLQKCYDLKSHKPIDEEAGFAVLSRWRHELVYKGVRRSLTADVARYLQLMFLDLLHLELGMPSRRLLASMLTSTGVDLRQIGLVDNRTADQKAAVAREGANRRC